MHYTLSIESSTSEKNTIFVNFYVIVRLFVSRSKTHYRGGLFFIFEKMPPLVCVFGFRKFEVEKCLRRSPVEDVWQYLTPSLL